MEKRVFRYNKEFVLESGQSLPGIEICYHISKEYLSGQENDAPTKKVVWITHALTANSNPCEWWDTMVGEGKYLDPRKYTIVCANILGSCYGSTSPLSINPHTGKPYMLSFPKTTVRDIAACHELLRKELGIEEIELLVGGSVGGFQALEWSIMNPAIIKNMILLACGSRVTPWLGAFNETMRMCLAADPTFEAQEYEIINGKVVEKGGKKGLAAARALALISYRSYTGYGVTQPEKDTDTMWCTRVGSYQQYQGKKLVDRYDAYSYNSMVYITDSHNVGRGRGGVEAALATVAANTICVGIDSDFLFPCCEQKYMAQHIPGAQYREISSLFGHDGFLLEWEQITRIFKETID